MCAVKANPGRWSWSQPCTSCDPSSTPRFGTRSCDNRVLQLCPTKLDLQHYTVVEPLQGNYDRRSPCQSMVICQHLNPGDRRIPRTLSVRGLPQFPYPTTGLRSRDCLDGFPLLQHLAGTAYSGDAYTVTDTRRHSQYGSQERRLPTSGPGTPRWKR